jgi:hypothetical protein
MYPQTALEAFNYIKSIKDHGYLELLIERDSYGATPYLSGRTVDGWTIAWHPDMLDYQENSSGY